MPRAKGDPIEQYERKKRIESARNRAKTAASADIGEIPPVENPERRARGLASLLEFLSYFPQRFPLPFSPDHLRAIKLLELAITVGGLFALAMARGSGKTTICECAAIWAVFTGRHEMVALVGSTEDAAEEILGSIKIEIETNDLLLADFPEICYPVHKLEGNTQRARNQTYKGVHTRIKWQTDRIVFPRIEGSVVSEAVIRVAGITGRVRGMKHTRSDGRVVRPTFVLPDDPQTDKSAASPSQCATRMKILNGAILKLSGPGQKISAVCPCTVIRMGDVADQILDRDRNPHWQGQRCKTLYKFPDRMDLWREYSILRAEALRSEGSGDQAREFYAIRQAEMDAGAEVAWPQRFDPGDLSALQTALHSFFDDRYSFEAELQNTPIDEERLETDLKPGDVAVRFSGRARGRVPIWASKITSFIDVQQSLLYWMVAAWDPSNFSGTVLDYGTWPDQPSRKYYTLADAHHTIQQVEAIKSADLKGQLDYAIKECTKGLLGREWMREDDVGQRIDRLMIDSGFEMDVVFEAIRAMGLANVLPSRGQPIGAKNKPMADESLKPGDQRGFHWLICPQRENRRGIRWCRIDVNFWKSFLVTRLKQAIGDSTNGALTLFGSSRQDADHGMLADHLTSERGIEVKANGREIVEWELRAGRPDNHFLDGLVGCFVGASIEGATLAGQSPRQAPRKPTSFAAQAAAQRAKIGR